jgi:L-aminopeptidase/D-esterase-like protein
VIKGLTDISGIRVGHASDFNALTGCTAILFDGGAVAGVDIRGSATGTAEMDTMNPGHVTDRIHAVVFAGGSAFGLEAASGVRRFLEKKGVGFETGAAKVPIVPCAILYDLAIGKANVRPTREMGEAAAAAATDDAVKEGCVGAGTGATVGKLLSMGQAMKSGVGSATVTLEGPLARVRVSALAVVNAVGDVHDPKSGALIAGARRSRESMELVDSEQWIKRGGRGGFRRENTTLALVATNAKLNKVQATKLAQMAHLGMARTIYPVNTMSDGDLVIGVSVGDESANVDALGVAAAEALAEAIVRAVKLSPSMGGLPGLASLAQK